MGRNCCENVRQESGFRFPSAGIAAPLEPPRRPDRAGSYTERAATCNGLLWPPCGARVHESNENTGRGAVANVQPFLDDSGDSPFQWWRESAQGSQDLPYSTRGQDVCSSTVNTTSKRSLRRFLEEEVEHKEGPPYSTRRQEICSSVANTTTESSLQRFMEDEAGRKEGLYGGKALDDTTRVLLSVAGMDCTGCENKLLRVLRGVPGVSNVKTSFLHAHADFDLDQNITLAQDAIKRVHQGTGFTVTRKFQGLQRLEILVDKTEVAMLTPSKVPGLVSIAASGKSRATLTYDPNVVGARDLLKQIFGADEALPSRLAPSAEPSGTSMLLRAMALKTLVATILTLPVVVLAWSPVAIRPEVAGTVSLAFATCVQAIAATEFYVNAFRSLWYDRQADLDTLVVLSITAAYLYSIIAFGLFITGRSPDTKGFFETSTLLITLVLAGRLISTYARDRSVQAVSVRSLQEATAVVLDGEDKVTEVDARLLQFGDVLVVKPEARIPTDGVVLEGRSEVDESMLTGESRCGIKQKGNVLLAGTVNGAGQLKARLVRLPGSNTITDIADLVEDANRAKAPVQTLADRLAGWFVPVVLAVAVVTFVCQFAASLSIREERAGPAVGTATTFAIAVLAVSCPCALGLAVPMVLVIAGGIAARAGIIIKSAEATERSWQITDIVFDKTGTLTNPDLRITDECVIGGDLAGSRSIAYAVVHGNKHPISQAVAKYLVGKCEEKARNVQALSTIPGCGIEGDIDGKHVKVGSPSWLSLENHMTVRGLIDSGKTVVCVTSESRLVLVYGLETTLRPEAAAVVHTLQDRGIDLHLISGDASDAVGRCAEQLGISPSNVRAHCSPLEKQAYVLSLGPIAGGSRPCVENKSSRGSRRRRPPARKVIMVVGDGTNDAVALASASVGVQVGTTSEVVSSVADVSLLGGLDGIVSLLDISRMAYRRIVFNFVWAALYNVVAVLLAAGALVKVRIAPRWAGLGELVSVLPVVLVASSMLVFKHAAPPRAPVMS